MGAQALRTVPTEVIPIQASPDVRPTRPHVLSLTCVGCERLFGAPASMLMREAVWCPACRPGSPRPGGD